jgi:hypothetical protein
MHTRVDSPREQNNRLAPLRLLSQSDTLPDESFALRAQDETVFFKNYSVVTLLNLQNIQLFGFNNVAMESPIVQQWAICLG